MTMFLQVNLQASKGTEFNYNKNFPYNMQAKEFPTSNNQTARQGYNVGEK